MGDTDESARREAKPHFEIFRNRFLKMPFEMLLPPGYTSRESMRGIAAAKGSLSGDITLEKAVELGMFLCGSASTVRETLESYWRDMRFGNLLTMCQFGTLPADMTRANMERFARDVLPAIQKLGAETEALVAA